MQVRKPETGQGWCVLLSFQEQIQGPKNASIARFDGLDCYQTNSEIDDGLFRVRATSETGLQPDHEQVQKAVRKAG